MMNLWFTLPILLVGAFPSYQEKFFNQSLDHFHPESHDRWLHRYLSNDDHWDGRGKLPNGCKGPILLYTGNEGDITNFWGANGFMIEVLAPKWGALLLFPEERYYGRSLPFGEESWTASNLEYLTTEQVLADYVELLDHLKSTLPDAANCPVVAFGGSYGGTLTTFLRTSYPTVVVGGLASSAPIGYYNKEGWASHGVSEYSFYDIVIRDYEEAHPQCMSAIEAASAAIKTAALPELLTAFHVCEESGLGPNARDELFVYALESLPQQNYPYPIGSNPGWPVNATCHDLVAAMGSAESLVAAAGSFSARIMGWAEGDSCIQTLTEGPGGVPGDGPGPDSWGYQSCTQNLHQFSAHRFRNFTFSLPDLQADCSTLFNSTVLPDTQALTRRFGGYEIPKRVTNMIWSNGALDPWSGGGFLTPYPETGNTWIYLEKGAHHFDLRGPHPEDPAEVTRAREQSEAIIRGWIDSAARA